MAGWSDYGGSSGGSSSSGGTTTSRGVGWGDLGASATPSTKKSGGGGLFSHLPKLGLVQLARMPQQIAAGIGSAVEGLAPGGRPAGQIPAAFAKGAAASGLGTFARIGNAITLGQLNHVYHEDPATTVAKLVATDFGFKPKVNPAEYESLKEAAHGYYNKGLLPGLLNDVGNISLVGGAGAKAASLGDVGKTAEAAVTASKAEAAGRTAEEIAQRAEQFKNASRLQRAASEVPILNRLVKGAGALAGGDKVLNAAARAKLAAEGVGPVDEAALAARARWLERFHGLQHPISTLFNEGVRPLTRAAAAEKIAQAAEAAGMHGEGSVPTAPVDEAAATQAAKDELASLAAASKDAQLNKTRAILNNAAAEAAPGEVPPVSALTPEEQVAKLEGMLPTEAPTAPAEPNPATMGPRERRMRAQLNQPIPETAKAIAQAVPESVRNRLAKIEDAIVSHQLRGAIREHARMVEGFRNQVTRSPGAQNYRDAIQSMLDSGVVTDADAANRMIYGHVATALEGRQMLLDGVATDNPVALAAATKAMQMDPISAEIFARVPGLEDNLNSLVEAWKAAAGQRADILTSSARLGAKGLEDLGSTQVKLTRKQTQTLKSIQKLQARINGPLKRGAALEAQRAEAAIAAHEARIAGLGERGQTLAVKIAGLKEQIAQLSDGQYRMLNEEDIATLRTKTTAQLAASLPTREGETASQALRRGYLAGKAIERIQRYTAEQKMLLRNAARVTKMKSDLATAIAENTLPRARLLSKESVRLATQADRLATQLEEHATIRQIPAEWQPMWQSLRDVQKVAMKDSVVAEAISGLPQTFSDLVAYAKERGFDPTHLSSLTERDVKRLVYSPIELGRSKGIAAEVSSNTRLLRSNAYSRTQSLEALVAAQVDVVWERETNHMIDLLDQHVARPYVPDTPGWVPWDDQRGFLSTGEHLPANQRPEPTMMIPKHVADTIKRMSGDYRHPLWDKLGRSKIIHGWKALVMTWVPGHYTNVGLGQFVLSAAQGAKLSDYVAALVNLRTGKFHSFDTAAAWLETHGHGILPEGVTPEQLSQVGARSEYAVSTEAIASHRSLIPQPKAVGPITATREAEGVLQSIGAGAVATKDTVLRVQDRLNAFNASLHRLGRAATYIAGRRQGLSDLESLQRSYEALVDYDNLSPFERAVGTTVFPFYAFQKGLLQLVSRFPLDHPLRVGLGIQLANLNETLLNPGLPPYYQGLIHLPGSKGTMMSLRAVDPFQDSLYLASPEGLSSAMNPALQAIAMNVLHGQNGFVNNYTVDEFGHVVPDTSPAQDLVSELTGSQEGSVIRSLTGLGGNGNGVVQGIGNFVGARTYTPEQIAAYRKRFALARMRASGQMHQAWEVNKGVDKKTLEAQYGLTG